MEGIEITQEDLRIDNLGSATIPSPLGLSTELGDDIEQLGLELV